MNSAANKKMLWDVLYKNDLFSGLNNSDLNDVIKQFEENIISINNKYSTDSLLKQNKLFISSFIDILNNRTNYNVKNTSEIYKREDIRDIELKEFSEKHNKIVADFNKFKPYKPDDIDFSDKVEEETTNISSALNNLNYKRNNEISIEKLYELMSEIKANQLTILSYIKLKSIDVSNNHIDTSNNSIDLLQ